MMKKVILFGMFVIFQTYFAQIGINTTTPDSSADLTLGSTNKGLLCNRVALNSTTDQTTISNPATGLLVYNTGAGSLTTKGYYYWDGGKWTRLSIADGSGDFQVGEERGYRYVVPGTFQSSAGNTNKKQMTGMNAANIGTINRKALSEFVDPSTLPLFEGLRVDLLGGNDWDVKPRFYNTTSQNITVSYAALSTANPNYSSPNMTILPNYYSKGIDGDDRMNCQYTVMEQDLVEILFADGKYYRLSITAYSTNASYNTAASNTVIGISLKRVQ